MKKRLLVAFLISAVAVAYYWPEMPAKAQSEYWTLRSASGDLTAAETSNEVATRYSSATVNLNITKLTLADADDEVDFYVQTSYGIDPTTAARIWVDTQNFHYSNADNGSTAKVQALIDGSPDGPGTTRSITGTNPAAGSEISETVPANAIWRIDALYASLVTDANPANRRVHVLIDDGTNTFYRSASASDQAESLTHYYSIGPHGITAAVTNTVHWIPLPPYLALSAGYRIQTSTVNAEAGDDWTAPQLEVEEWHDDTIITDGTLRDNVRAYNRPLGTHVRIKTAVTGATAPTYAYSATLAPK